MFPADTYRCYRGTLLQYAYDFAAEKISMEQSTGYRFAPCTRIMHKHFVFSSDLPLGVLPVSVAEKNVLNRKHYPLHHLAHRRSDNTTHQTSRGACCFSAFMLEIGQIISRRTMLLYLFPYAVGRILPGRTNNFITSILRVPASFDDGLLRPSFTTTHHTFVTKIYLWLGDLVPF